MRRQLGAAVSALLDAVTKTYADLKMSFSSTWSNTAAYSINDVVTYNGNSYVCTTAVAAAAATSVIGSATYTTDSASNYQIALPAGSAAGDVVVWLITETTTGTSAAAINTPSGATKLNSNSAGFVSTNELNSAVFLYTLLAADIVNGYLALPNPASSGAQLRLSSVIYVVRNLTVTTTATAKAATLATPSVTTTVPSYLFHILAGTLQGGVSNTETCAGTTAISYVNAIASSSLTTNHVSAIAYESQAVAGASSARTFAGTIANGSSGTESYQLAVQSSAGTNTAPDKSANWVALGSVEPAGSIGMFGGAAAPAGYLMCDGTSYLRTDYPALFTAIGTSYGTVDGTHFTVPDLRARFPVGQGSVSPFATVGASGGGTTHTHPLSDAGGAAVLLGSASQQRRVNIGWTSTTSQSGTASATSTAVQTIASGLVGNTDSANHTPPFQVVNFIIKT